MLAQSGPVTPSFALLLSAPPQASLAPVTEGVGAGTPLYFHPLSPIPLTFFPQAWGAPASPAASGAVGLRLAPFLPSAHPTMHRGLSQSL